MKFYNKYGADIYNLYTNNGTFQPISDPDKNLSCDLDGQLFSEVRNELFGFLENLPHSNELSLEELDGCLQGFTGIVDSRAIYQVSVVMEIIRSYQISLDPLKLLEKAVRSVTMELFKNEKFYSKRPAQVAKAQEKVGSIRCRIFKTDTGNWRSFLL